MGYFSEKTFIVPALYGFFIFLLHLLSRWPKISQAPQKYFQGQVSARVTQISLMLSMKYTEQKINLDISKGPREIRRENKRGGWKKKEMEDEDCNKKYMEF